MRISCIILAGGKSSRIGKYKPLLKIKNKPIIWYVYRVVKKIFKEIVVVVKDDKQKKKIEKVLKKVKVVEDRNKIYSPVAGIKEGIKHVKEDYVFIVAADMPFIKEKTIRELISRFEKVDCICYFWKLGMYEPLCAIYRKKIFKDVDEKKSLHSLIENSKKKILVPIGRETKEFFNVNTVKDLENMKKTIN